MMCWRRWLDLLRDPRMPQYAFYHKIGRRGGKRGTVALPEGLTILVVLTFDIEYDFGSAGGEAAVQAVGPFLKHAGPWGKEMGAALTLFVQGDLVAGLAGYLRELEKENEIGLHGYSHELWGGAKWFLPHKPLPLETKRGLLERSLEQFSTHHLARPVSFRAPDLVTDRETLELLESYGFTVDSSAPSYYGVAPELSRPLGPGSKLLEIPVTARPYSRTQFRCFLPFTSYEVFNMFQVTAGDDRHFTDYVDDVLTFQVKAGVMPHLVFLAHPWEFQEWPARRRLDYCAQANYELLRRRFSLLRERYRLSYVTLSEMARYVGGGTG